MARKTAVLYARYSSDKQREASIDDQLRVCRDWCALEGIEVVREYADRAKSGRTDQRPEFRQMVANAPESDFVVVYMFDRFSRDRYDSALYKRELRRCGVRVLSAMEPVDDSPEGDLHEGLLELLGEYYVADLARKVRRGMEGNALRAMDNGYKLYGYDTDPATRRYVVNEAEATVVREAFSRHVAGESIYAIAERLASRGVVTSTGTPVDYNWVWRVLNRKAYTGTYSWAGIEVEGGMPVIVDEDTFERSRRMPKRRARRGEHNATYRLTGKLWCGLCGQPMHGYSAVGRKGQRYYYYGCKDKGGCGRRGTRRELVEGAFADAVLDMADDEERVRRIARNVVASYDEGRDSRAELDAVEARMADLRREQHHISQAAMKGLLTDEMVDRNKAIDSQIESLRSRHGILLGEDVGVGEDEIVEFLLHGFDRSDEGFIFGSWAHRVWLFDGFLLVEFNFRDEAGDLEEVRVSLDAYRRRHPEIEGFGWKSHEGSNTQKHPGQSRPGCDDAGVGGGT